jgi:transcriptional regulator with XRE-family HTH domain
MDSFEFVKKELSSKRWIEMKAIAERASISPYTVWNMVHGRTLNPSHKTVMALEAVLRAPA